MALLDGERDGWKARWYCLVTAYDCAAGWARGRSYTMTVLCVCVCVWGGGVEERG